MPNAVFAAELAEFQCLLIGTWTNEDDKELIDPKTKLPLSFNVMPLPQIELQKRVNPQPPPPPNTAYGGFILKNFAFTETIRFNGSAKNKDEPKQHQDPAALAVIAGAPNRGGSYTQFSHAVFYDQQVKFAEGPAAHMIVHVENGAWLHLDSIRQVLGPYELNPPPPNGPGGPFVNGDDGQVLPQPPYITIAKQISVPHGNSVLALGSVDIRGTKKKDGKEVLQTILPGRPVIADAFIPYPQPADIAVAPSFDPYKTLLKDNADYENPNPPWTWNANKPLQEAIEIIKPQSFLHWSVTTNPMFGGKGHVTNIPFEERKSNVIAYWADYWMLSCDPIDKKDAVFDYLAYSQTILMEMDIFFGDYKIAKEVADPANYRRYIFPHVTTNTVKKVKGTPTEARKKTEGLEGG
jgi:hypothetical protein